MTNSLFFLDSNVFMYCFGTDHPLKVPCERVINSIGDGTIVAVINTEVLQEILHRFFLIKRRDLAYQLYDCAIGLCQAVLPVSLSDTNRAKEILLKNRNIEVRDAIHAACMLNNNIKEVITADRHFDQVKRIKRIDPLKFSSSSQQREL